MHQQNQFCFRFATWALEEYGDRVHWKSPWGRLVNSDFSGPIGRLGKRNSKNDIVWAKDINSVRYRDGNNIFVNETYSFNELFQSFMCLSKTVFLPSNQRLTAKVETVLSAKPCYSFIVYFPQGQDSLLGNSQKFCYHLYLGIFSTIPKKNLTRI